MTVIESIMRGVHGLSLRQQIEVAQHVQRLNASAEEERVEVLSRTHGCLSEADGRAFEDAVEESRQIESHG